MSRITPSLHLLLALAAWLALGMASAWQPTLISVWWMTLAAIVVWGFADYLLAHWQELPAVQRVVAGSLSVGEWIKVELRLHWQGRVPRYTEVFDHHPDGFAQQGLPAAFDTGGKNTFVLHYRLRPLSRGDHQFAGVALRSASPLGAWRKQSMLAAAQTVRVYPNFAPLARHALRAVDHRNARVGMLKRRRRGQGMDFDQLREYREGDSMRQIDWKASTRMGKMISREYQDERDQRILLMIDCGRRMAARDDALSHFDHALDAVLMLAYVGIKHGDSVGLSTLGGEHTGDDRFLPARHTPGTISQILHALYDLQPGMQASDFERAAQQLLRRERKRALVVIFTNLRDEDDQSLLAAVRLLRSRHLVLVASLRETALDAALSHPADSLHSAQQSATLAAAVGYRSARETTLRKLRAEGVLCIDVAPQDLAVESVNRYLAVKAAQQL